MSGRRLWCPACRQQVPVRERPLFDGFEKIGVVRHCAFCSEEIREEELPASSDSGRFFSGSKRSRSRLEELFGGQPIESSSVNPFGGPIEVPKPVIPFAEPLEGVPRICRHCRHYVVHPFTQKCMLHEREVTATDSCERFEARQRC